MEEKKQKSPVQEPADALNHVEDRALKVAAQFFGKELLGYFGINGKIKEVYPTEYVHLEMKQMDEDFNYLMENGECYHFEFESDGITGKDLRRFRAYEAVTSHIGNVPVVTYVLCSGRANNQMTSLTEGINTYRVRVVWLRDRDAGQLFEKLEEKGEDNLTKEELLSVILSPLMGGKLPQRERFRKGFYILGRKHDGVEPEEQRRMKAILYVFAGKFLSRKEMEEMEECSMTELGEVLVERGYKRGIAQCVISILKEVGAVDAALSEKITGEKDEVVLNRWLKLAAHSESVEEFRKEM